MNNKETIIFGGGCFWCIEAVFKRLKGVEGVSSGYSGGDNDTATYEEVSSGSTGHAEVVKVEFDPNIINLQILLDVFFASHDPTTLNKQGDDVGSQYRSVIFYMSQGQKEGVETYIQKLADEKVFNEPIVTEVKPANKFYSAESHHQDFYSRNRQYPYCTFVIDPKIAKLREKFAPYLKQENEL